MSIINNTTRTSATTPEITTTSSDFVIENGVLTRYRGPGGDVVIPEGVTSIDGAAFYKRNDLTSVTIPEGVARIGSITFAYCTGLTEITIPASVTSIGEWAFSNCTNLRKVRGLKRSMQIDTEAFYGSLWEAKKIQREVPIRALIVLAILSAIIFGGAALLAAFTNCGYGTALLEMVEGIVAIGILAFCCGGYLIFGIAINS